MLALMILTIAVNALACVIWYRAGERAVVAAFDAGRYACKRDEPLEANPHIANVERSRWLRRWHRHRARAWQRGWDSYWSHQVAMANVDAVADRVLGALARQRERGGT